MPEPAATGRETVVLERGAVRVTVTHDPVAIEIRRGRRLIRGMGLWAAAGRSRDQFIQLTEGVIAAEELEQPRRLDLGLATVALEHERVVVELRPEPGCFRPGTGSRSPRERPPGPFACTCSPTPTRPPACATSSD